MGKKVRLNDFTTGNFDKGAGIIKITLWYFVNAMIVRASWNPFMSIKIFLLRLFGARIGKNCIIKNEVRIKFPWKLIIGDNVWLGERCWIDNLDNVTIGSNVCISQDALLITGNHDYTLYNMPYRNAPIVLHDGCWIGARAIVAPGVTVKENAILTLGSIATKNLDSDSIYQGNPAIFIRKRDIKDISLNP